MVSVYGNDPPRGTLSAGTVSTARTSATAVRELATEAVLSANPGSGVVSAAVTVTVFCTGGVRLGSDRTTIVTDVLAPAARSGTEHRTEPVPLEGTEHVPPGTEGRGLAVPAGTGSPRTTLREVDGPRLVSTAV